MDVAVLIQACSTAFRRPWRLDISAALKGQEKIAQAEWRAKPGAAPWVTGHPRKGTLKGCNTPLVPIVALQGADDSLGS